MNILFCKIMNYIKSGKFYEDISQTIIHSIEISLLILIYLIIALVFNYFFTYF